MENRAPKEKHCYIAEVFCSLSILVSCVTNAIHNEKQNAGILNRNLLCFLIAWIVPSFSSIPWKKGNGRQESFLHIACTTGDGNCIMPAVSLRNESILAEGSDQYTEMIFILLCVTLLCPFMHQTSLRLVNHSEHTREADVTRHNSKPKQVLKQHCSPWKVPSAASLSLPFPHPPRLKEPPSVSFSDDLFSEIIS